MRKPVALFVAAFATVAGGGFAVALEDPSGPSGPATEEHDEVDDEVTTTTALEEETIEVEVDDDEADEVEEVEVEEVEVEEVEADGGDGVHPDNHGAAVSAAADVCPHDDPAQNHGQCVSAVARDHDGDGTADHGRGSPDHPGRGNPHDE